jgi:hypothetical protein
VGHIRDRPVGEMTLDCTPRPIACGAETVRRRGDLDEI